MGDTKSLLAAVEQLRAVHGLTVQRALGTDFRGLKEAELRAGVADHRRSAPRFPRSRTRPCAPPPTSCRRAIFRPCAHPASARFSTGSPFRKYIREWGFRRGFLERIIADLGKFLEGLPALSREPIERARLTAYRAGLLPRIHQAAPLPTLWMLELGNSRLGASDLELVGSAWCSKLRGLSLTGNRFGDAGAMAPKRASAPSQPTKRR